MDILVTIDIHRRSYQLWYYHTHEAKPKKISGSGAIYFTNRSRGSVWENPQFQAVKNFVFFK